MTRQLRCLLFSLAILAWLAGCSASRHSEGEIMAAGPAQLLAIVKSLQAEQGARPDSPELQYLLARALLRAGKAEDAERLALEAMRRNPFEGSVMNLLGDIHAAQNKRFRAINAYSEAINLDPDLLAAYVSLGRTRHALGQEEEAEQALGEAVRREPGYYPAQYDLARVLFEVGRPELAAQVAAAARRIRPDSLEAQLLEIRIKKAQGHLTVAAYLVGRALRSRPRSTPLRREMLDIHLQRKQWDQAIRLLDEIEAQGGLATEDLLLKAEVLHGRGRRLEAARLMQDLLRRDPSHPRVMLALARASIVRGDPEAALRTLEGAVRQNPNSVNAQFLKAVAHYQLGQDARGNAALDIATTLAPHHPPVRLLRVRRLLLERKLSAAAPLLNAYLSAYPGDGNALLIRSELHTLLGNYEAADRDLRAIVPTGSDDALRFAKGRLAYLRGAFRAVLAETRPLVKRPSTPWQLVYLHGAALLRLGRGGQALPLLTARLRAGQGAGELHRLAGEIHHLAGARGKAERLYRAGLEKYPRQARLLEGLTRLAIEAGKWEQARKWLEAGMERPGALKSRFLERLRLVYLRLKKSAKARSFLERYLAETDPLLRDRDLLDEQRILFNAAFPAIGYAPR